MRQLATCLLALAAIPAIGCRASVVSDSGVATSDGGVTAAACDTPAGKTTVILEGLHAYGISVERDYVYAATPQGIWRVSRTGGTPTQISGTEEADAVAISADHVYWTGNYTIGGGSKPQSGIGLFSAPITGGPATLLTPDAWSTQIVIDDTSVYGATPSPWSVPTQGGAVTTLMQSAPLEASGIALYGSDLYATVAPPHASLVRVPKTGGAPTVLVNHGAHPAAIAVDSSGLYWTEYAYQGQQGGIYQAALDGSKVTRVAGDENASAITTDADSVYWSTQNPNAIFSTPKSGGPVVTVASGLQGPAALQQWGGNVYWAEQPEADAASAPGTGGIPTVLTACKP